MAKSWEFWCHAQLPHRPCRPTSSPSLPVTTMSSQDYYGGGNHQGQGQYYPPQSQYHPASRRLSSLMQSASQIRLRGRAGTIPSSPSKATKVALVIKVNLVNISSPTLDLDTPRNRHLSLSMCLYSQYAKRSTRF